MLMDTHPCTIPANGPNFRRPSQGHAGVTSHALMATVPHFWIVHFPPLQSSSVMQDVGPFPHVEA